MDKISKDEARYYLGCGLYNYACNDNQANMRERYVLQNDDGFILIEGNTRGWFYDETDQISAAFDFLMGT